MTSNYDALVAHALAELEDLHRDIIAGRIWSAEIIATLLKPAVTKLRRAVELK